MSKKTLTNIKDFKEEFMAIRDDPKRKEKLQITAMHLMRAQENKPGSLCKVKCFLLLLFFIYLIEIVIYECCLFQ